VIKFTDEMKERINNAFRDKKYCGGATASKDGVPGVSFRGHQISMRVPTLDDLRTFYRRLVAEGFKIDHLVTHGSAIGCYFFDPEGNRTEVFWLTGRSCWVPVSVAIDIEQPDDAVMARVDEVWRQLRHVPVGGKPDAAAAAFVKLV
jgi:hypothetical protein